MITASPSAPLGTVETWPHYFASDFRKGDSVAVLCRNNAPLVTHAFACIRRNTPVCILGRDLGESLKKTIKSWKISEVGFAWQEAAYDKLQGWFQREERKVKKPAQLAALQDKRDCLCTILKSAQGEAAACSSIEKLFTSAATPGSLVLATGHKAKGLEWDHVFILDQHLIPSRYATTQADLFQERNVLYVMVTRAKQNLTYIKSNTWKN